MLKSYRTEIFRPECNNSFQSLHCIAYLDQDIGDALPYINAVLEGDSYIKEPPSVTFKMHGKLLTLHARKIAINALRDEDEAVNTLEWLRKEINAVWHDRAAVTPKFTGRAKPHILEIYKLLPKTNCRVCGQPACMMFAALAAEGAKGSRDCPGLQSGGTAALDAYLSRFNVG